MNARTVIMLGAVALAAAMPAASFAQTPGAARPAKPPKATSETAGPRMGQLVQPASHMHPAVEEEFFDPTFPGDFGPACADGCGDALDCGNCGDCVNCCDLDWWPLLCGWDVFGEFLYLRARNAEVAYGVPIVTPQPFPMPEVQRGAVGVVDQEYHAGFRAGLGFTLHDEACVRVSYSQFDSTTDDAISTNPPRGIVALTVHPGTQSADTLFLTASATNHIAFEFLDVDYRRTWRNGASYALDWVAGARYAHLDQDFTATYRNLVTDQVRTAIDFDGGGLRLGLEGECWNHHGFSFYGKGAASFLAGEFRADYFHGNTPQPEILSTSWQAGRIVSILDMELGLAWTSPGGHWRVTSGYLFSGWFNTVNTQWFIDRVRANNFNELSEGLGFDGLSVRAELRF